MRCDSYLFPAVPVVHPEERGVLDPHLRRQHRGVRVLRVTYTGSAGVRFSASRKDVRMPSRGHEKTTKRQTAGKSKVKKLGMDGAAGGAAALLRRWRVDRGGCGASFRYSPRAADGWFPRQRRLRRRRRLSRPRKDEGEGTRVFGDRAAIALLSHEPPCSCAIPASR